MAKGRGKDPSALRAFPSEKTRHQSIFPFFPIVQPCTDTKAQPQIYVGYNQRVPPPPSRIKMARELTPLKQPSQKGSIRDGRSAAPNAGEEVNNLYVE